MIRGWIETDEMVSFGPDERLVLFGAGLGTEEFLDRLAETGCGAEVVAVADNDPGMRGRSIRGLPILLPTDLPGLAFDRIVVTTVSGREPVSRQLAAMGYRAGRDFLAVGRYPCQAVDNLELLLGRAGLHPFLPSGGRALHVGPGGFLGFECGLAAAAGCSVTALDAYGFGLCYPDVTDCLDRYREAGGLAAAAAARCGHDGELFLEAWQELFVQESGDGGGRGRTGRTLLDRDRIALLFPHRMSAMPVPDQAFDLVASFDVLEHVRDPARCVAEAWRVTRPGGWGLHRVITRDHRSCGRVEGFTPISYRHHSASEWDAMTRDRFHQNRVAPWQWRELFEAAGFTIEEHSVLDRYPPSEAELAALDEEFLHWPPERQAEVDCLIVVRRPA